MGRQLSAIFLALAKIAPAAEAFLARQPPTAQGAVEAAEKLAPQATPQGKVVDLLDDLIKKVEEDGKRDAAAYDKYACFCKEQADQKVYQNETSAKKVKVLSAEMDELDAAIIALAGEIEELSETISGSEAQVAKKTEARDTEHEAYLKKDADVVGAIDACGRAIESLKESKSAMQGKVEREALIQVHNAAAKAAALVALTASQVSSLDALVEKGRQPGQAYSSTYHSNDIIDTLEGLKDAFIDRKNSQDKDDFEANKVFEQERLGLQNKAKFAQMDKDQREEESAKKTARMAEATKERDLEESMRQSDMKFLDVLTGECSEKAQAWDENSRTRANELHALAEARDAISGAREGFERLAELNGFIQKADEGSGSLRARKERAPYFLQLQRGSGRESHRREKLLQILDSSAKRLKSPVLTMAALKARAAETEDPDHFVKVRGIIKDLIKRLEADATAEQTQKKWCDEEAKEAVSDRDDAQSTKEEKEKDIAIEDATVRSLNVDIAELSGEIATNKKALLEATELREGEKANNEEIMANAEMCKDQIEQAIGILHKFYDNAFVQRKAGKFVPKNSDRDGSTVGDLAPDDSFHEGYHGEQEASKGIFGLLEVLKSDFEKQISNTQGSEDTAQGEFDTLKLENEKDTKTKEKSMGEKETSVTDGKENILDLTGSRKEATASYDVAIEKLDKVKKMCVDKAETYEERTANREQEIEALKQAHAILEDWENQ